MTRRDPGLPGARRILWFSRDSTSPISESQQQSSSLPLSRKHSSNEIIEILSTSSNSSCLLALSGPFPVWHLRCNFRRISERAQRCQTFIFVSMRPSRMYWTTLVRKSAFCGGFQENGPYQRIETKTRRTGGRSRGGARGKRGGYDKKRRR